jgi:uncharacterized protein (TIGR02594 family)
MQGGALDAATEALQSSDALQATHIAPTPSQATVQPPSSPAAPPVIGSEPEPNLAAGGRADTAKAAVEEANPEGGRLPSDPKPNALDEGMLKARSAGYSWDEITGYLNQGAEKAKAAGYSDQEVSDFLGYGDKDRPLFGKAPVNPTDHSGLQSPDEVFGQAGAETLKAGANYIGSAITHPTDLVSGLEMSSGGMVLRSLSGSQQPGAPIAPTDQTPAALRAQQIGELLGDTPVAIVGAGIGGIVGGAATAGNPIGAGAGALFGMSTLPAYLRAHYADQLVNGPYKSDLDFSNRTAANMVESMVQGAPGIAAGLLGPVAGSIAGPLARIAVEGATLSGVGAAIQGHLPSLQDVLDSTLQVAALHGVANIPGAGATIKNNIMQRWVETGELPGDQVAHAKADPSFAQSLVAPPRPDIVPGSSITPAGSDGSLVINRAVVPSRVFDTAARMEGSTADDPATRTYLKAGGMDVNPSNTAWCAAFVNSTLEQSGVRGSGSLVATSFDNWGKPVADASTAQRGDVVVLDRGLHTGETGGHVGIATGATRDGPNGPQIEMLSGNESRKVMRTWEDASAIRVRRAGDQVAYTPDQVPQSLIDKINSHETGGEENPNAAVGPVNSTGEQAIGKGQIEPSTAKQYGFDPDDLHNPVTNAAAQKAILSDLSKRFQGEEKAIMIGYNAGPKVAERWIANGRDDSTLPEETQKYVAGEQAGAVSTVNPAEKAYQDRLQKAADVRDQRIAALKAGNTRWAEADGIDPIQVRYNADLAAAERARNFESAGNEYATRSGALPADISSVSDAYSAGAQAFADGKGRPTPPTAPRPAIRADTDQGEMLAPGGKAKANDRLRAAMAQGYDDAKARSDRALSATEADNGSENVTGHAGAGAAVPGQSDETMAPYVPPTYEEASARMSASIQDDTPPSTAEAFREWAGKAYRETLRPDDPLNKVQDAYENGHALDDVNNPRLLRRVAELSEDRADYGINHKAINLAGDEVGPGLREIIAPLKSPEDTAAFEVYAKARWAMEKAEQAKETGVAYDVAKAIVDKDGARFGPMFDQLVQFRNNSLALLRDSGIISPEQHDRWVEDNKAAVPGYRQDDTQPRNVSGASRGMKSRNPVHEMMGSELPTKPILKSIMQDHFTRTSLALRNQHNVAMTAITREMGISQAAEQRAIHVELTDAELRKIGADPEAAGDFYRKLNAHIGANDLVVFRDGKPQVEHFDDPLIAQALRGQDPVTLGVVGRMMKPLNATLRSGVALNPFFAIRNLIYDLPMRASVSGFQTAVGSFYHGVPMALGLKPELWNRWLRSGGSDYARAYLDTKYARDVIAGNEKLALGSGSWNALNSIPRALQAWNRGVMSVMPAGRFGLGVARGESDLRAGVASSEFKLHRPSYGGALGKAMNTQVPFLLAHMNGMEQTFRGMVGKPENATGESRSALAFHATALAAFTAPILVNWALAKDKEWYKAAPDWQKNNGLLFNVGSDANPVVCYIPFPPLIGMIYGGIPRMLVDKFSGANPDATNHMVASLAGALLPPGAGVIGGAAQTAIEILANHSFLTGRPIVPSDVVSSRLPPEQAVPWSSGTARTVSGWLNELGVNSSPPQIDHAIAGLTGTLGKQVTTGVDVIGGWGAHTPGGPETTWSDYPGLSSFLTRYPSASATPTSDFMDATNAIAQTHGSIEDALKNGDVHRAIELLKTPAGLIKAVALRTGQAKAMAAGSLTADDRAQWDQAYRQALANQTPEKLQAVRDLLVAQKAIGSNRNAAQAAQVNRTMSPMDKRQTQDQAYKNMQAWAERGNDDLRKLGL